MRGLLLTALAGIAPAAAAGPAAVDRATVLFATQTVELEWMDQGHGEHDAAFLARVAATVARLTSTLRVEVCGVFLDRGEAPGHRIQLVTQGSTTHCLSASGPGRADPSPEVLAGKSIHSHVQPSPGFAPLTCRDRLVIQHLLDDEETGAGARGVRRLTADFSDADYALGPGFLVYRDRLLHQHGRGTRAFVARLPPVDADDACLVAARLRIDALPALC